MVKCLAQGHNCHDRDLNPHSAEQNQQSLSSVLLSAQPRHPELVLVVLSRTDGVSSQNHKSLKNKIYM